jgi:hypothetical protein
MRVNDRISFSDCYGRLYFESKFQMATHEDSDIVVWSYQIKRLAWRAPMVRWEYSGGRLVCG